MAEFLLQKDYMALPKEVRAKVRAAFGIKKSGPVEVVQNVVVSDGVTSEDCMAVTSSVLRSYLGVEEGEFAALWPAAVEKACEPEITAVFVDDNLSDMAVVASELPNPDDGTIVVNVPEQMTPVNLVDGNLNFQQEVTKFCDSCDGKKKHLKHCPKNPNAEGFSQ